MSDDALREVLRSPLDDLPPPRGGLLWLLVALVLGTAAGFGIGAVLRSSPSEPAAAPETTTTAPPVTLPPGPIPVGDVAAEVVAAWEQGGRLYLAVATTVPPGTEPIAAPGLAGATWVLQWGAGTRTPATAELRSAALPGVFTVEFPGADLSGEVTLLAYPAAAVSEETFSVQFPSAQFPWDGTPTAHRLGSEEVVIDRWHLDDAGGEIAWHLGGDSTARATVDARVTYAEAGAGPQAMAIETNLPFGYLVAPAGSTQATRSGTVRLFHLDDVAFPSYRSRYWGDAARVVEVADVTVEITVRLYRYAAEAAVIPVHPALPEQG